MPTVVLSSPTDGQVAVVVAVGEEPDGGFDKVALNKDKEIRRRTSTNNSDQKAEFNALLVVNDEEDEDEEVFKLKYKLRAKFLHNPWLYKQIAQPRSQKALKERKSE